MDINSLSLVFLRTLVFSGLILFVQPTFSASIADNNSELLINDTEQVQAKNPVFQRKTAKSVTDVYDKLFTALENNAYFVVHEPDIGRTLSRFSQRWGKDYNKNGIKTYRSLVFCNAWYANAITNADPQMALLCPQQITLIELQNEVQVFFVLPSVIAENSPASPVVSAMENEITKIIDEVVQ